jgi:hypothetical protein
VAVPVPVSVGVAVSVEVCVGDGVRVTVGMPVRVAVTVPVDVLGTITCVLVAVKVAVGVSLGVGDTLMSRFFIIAGRKMPKGKVGVGLACAALVRLLDANAKQTTTKASEKNTITLIARKCCFTMITVRFTLLS